MDVYGETFQSSSEDSRIVSIVKQPLVFATEGSSLRREGIPNLHVSHGTATAAPVILRPRVLHDARRQRPLPKLPAPVNRSKRDSKSDRREDQERCWKREPEDVNDAQSLADYCV